MIRFAALYNALDSTTKTNEKIAAMRRYFADAPHDDAAWATFFLAGNKLRQIVPTKLLRAWAAQRANVPMWLFEESYHAVGDLAETLSLVVPPGEVQSDDSLTFWIQQRLEPLRKMDEEPLREAVLQIWDETPAAMRLVVMKLITGAFRVGVSKRLVTRAIAEYADVPADVVAHRLMGSWKPTADFFASVIDPDSGDTLVSQPYPFCLAAAIDNDVGPAPLGDCGDYSAEWKWDGIRGQVIRRSGQTFIWSRGEDLMENRWPEIESAAQWLPDGTVIDGEILASLADGTVLPFAELQRRIGRKTVGKKLLTEVPVIFHAFDLLEDRGEDLRALPMHQRRERLENLLNAIDHAHLRPTVILPSDSWDHLAKIREGSREKNAEGLMLKHRDSVYEVGRVRGAWFKWKVNPYTIDAVLIYAQRGSGKRASLYTDYTFALWRDGELVPFAKAYSGLDDAEIRKVDRFVRTHTKEAFGPVRSVTPELVMELAFEGLQKSTRHKSGVATRFPRIVRWRHDKTPRDANTLEDLQAMMPSEAR